MVIPSRIIITGIKTSPEPLDAAPAGIFSDLAYQKLLTGKRKRNFRATPILYHHILRHSSRWASMFIKYLQLRRAFSGFCQKKRPAQSGSHGQERIGSYVHGKAPPDKLQRQKNQKNGQQCRRCIQAIPSNTVRSAVVKKATPAVRAGGIRRPFLSRPWVIFSQNQVQDTSARVTHRKLSALVLLTSFAGEIPGSSQSCARMPVTFLP